MKVVGNTDYRSVLLLDVLKFKNLGIFKSEIEIWLLLLSPRPEVCHLCSPKFPTYKTQYLFQL